MATLTAQSIVRTGLAASYASCDAGGDEFVNNQLEWIRVKNDDASAKTVTVVTQQTVDGLAIADQEIVVAAGTVVDIGPFSSGVYNDSGGKVQLTYSAVTSLSIALLKLTTDLGS